jgi:alanine racemase
MDYNPAMQARARLTIDLDALAANHALLKAQAGASEVAPVVKADAYGLGAAQVAGRLWAEGARTFFVARLEEGEALRAALGPQRPAAIQILDGAVAGAARRLTQAGLTPVLNSLAQIEDYAAHGRREAPLPCTLHLDTGMNRLGLRLEEAEALAASDRLDRLRVEMVMSHLACADDPDDGLSARQVGRLRAIRRLFPQARFSLANSAGTFLGPDFTFDLVRPGITLYGGGPFERPDPRVRPVVAYEAPILQVRAVPAGETVGYGAAYVAAAPVRAAIVAAGYADGLLRASSPGGGLWFAGARRALLGRVSMDLAAIDVTGCEAATPGAMVEILGPNRPLDAAAAEAGSIAYELLTRLGARAERVYLGG